MALSFLTTLQLLRSMIPTFRHDSGMSYPLNLPKCGPIIIIAFYSSVLTSKLRVPSAVAGLVGQLIPPCSIFSRSRMADRFPLAFFY